MENIILTNNKDLRLVSVKVGVLSTLRFELPLVSASATHVEVIVTSGNVPSAYTATFIDATKRWQCDIAASQFPTVGRQSYEVAYVLDGKQFWDGKGWIEIENATTSGIEPQPRPEPYRYTVVSVNGYGADAQGAVRIPMTFIATDSPVTTEGYIEGDIYFNRETGATWTLCNVQSTLTWVFNYKNYYTKAETDEAIDKLAAYYITADAQGNPFATHAALVNAQTYYSGGAVRIPTRNDYAVVSADETHGGAEWRYIYAVDAQGVGQWEPQYAVEGVIAYDNTVTRTSANGVKSSGIWSALWGALAALPTGFTSLYDWVVSQLARKQPSLNPSTVVVPGGIKTVSTSVNHQGSIVILELPTSGVTVNGKALTDDVTLTGADIPVDATQGAQKINAALDDKVDEDNGFVNNLTVNGLRIIGQGSQRQMLLIGDHGQEVGSDGDGIYNTAGNERICWVFGQGDTAFATRADIAPKYDGATSHSYVVGQLVAYGDGGYNTKIYRCVTAHTATSWVAENWALATVEDVLAALRTAMAGKADKCVPQTAGNLAALDAEGNPTDSLIPAANVAAKGDIPYSLGTPAVIDTASSETVEGETVNYGAATLADRTANIVQVTAATALDELRITFPAATSGKVRDFGLRVEIGTGSAALAAPALVPIAPTGETIKIENADGTIPAIADGTATAKGVTLLYFSETAPGVFVVKGEQVEEVA